MNLRGKKRLINLKKRKERLKKELHIYCETKDFESYYDVKSDLEIVDELIKDYDTKKSSRI